MPFKVQVECWIGKFNSEAWSVQSRREMDHVSAERPHKFNGVTKPKVFHGGLFKSQKARLTGCVQASNHPPASQFLCPAHFRAI
jgi:hypothetical protein